MGLTGLSYHESGAIFDTTGRYRYTLWRAWCADHARVVFIMLNPSTADEQTNDPTIRRCIGFAQRWGFGSLEVVNLFAYRATSPHDLLKADDPIGRENDHFLVQALARAGCIVAAWGTKGTLLRRDKCVIQLLDTWRNVQCLGTTKAGHPRHPLYVRAEAELVDFQVE
jgi:hypothetical protein